mgnify:FL=1
MNATVYLFGKFENGYSQYPDDYTSGIFNEFQKNAKSTTQLVIHRDNCLMYYGYIRKLEKDRYIGLCVMLNDLMLTHIDGLFSLFEHTVSGLVERGQLIHYNEQGNIVSNVDKLYMNKEDVDMLNESLRTAFNRFETYASPLPAVNYGVSKDSVRSFVEDDNPDEIVKSGCTNGYTFIYKSKGFNTAQMESFRGMLSKVNSEKQELQQKLEKLQTEHKKTLRQKKQFKIVIALILVLVLCVGCLYLLNVDLNSTRENLFSAENTIREQKDLLDRKNDSILNLTDKNLAETARRVEAESSLERLNSMIKSRQPFIVTRTSFDFSTGYLSFDYYGIKEETITLRIRAYNDNGDRVYREIEFNVEKGTKSASVYVSSYLEGSKYYSFEIMKDNIILGGGRH